MPHDVSEIATNLDIYMIRVNGGAIAPANTRDLPLRTGSEVAEELGGRFLLRFIPLREVSTYRYGTSREIFTTPTPYPPDRVVSALELPGILLARPFVLVLDPSQIDLVQGPRYVEWGLGVEYILPRGFEPKAIASKWEVQLR